jgi:hypothetical protein
MKRYLLLTCLFGLPLFFLNWLFWGEWGPLTLYYDSVFLFYGVLGTQAIIGRIGGYQESLNFALFVFFPIVQFAVVGAAAYFTWEKTKDGTMKRSIKISASVGLLLFVSLLLWFDNPWFNSDWVSTVFSAAFPLFRYTPITVSSMLKGEVKVVQLGLLSPSECVGKVLALATYCFYAMAQFVFYGTFFSWLWRRRSA